VRAREDETWVRINLISNNLIDASIQTTVPHSR
jgi:hypothetical protein